MLCDAFDRGAAGRELPGGTHHDRVEDSLPPGTPKRCDGGLRGEDAKPRSNTQQHKHLYTMLPLVAMLLLALGQLV